jgi:hypothetical protein
MFFVIVQALRCSKRAKDRCRFLSNKFFDYAPMGGAASFQAFSKPHACFVIF